MGYKIEWQNKHVTATFDGVIDFRILNQANNTIISNAKFKILISQIFDFRKVDIFNVDAREVQLIGTFDKSSTIWNKEIKIATVTSDPYIRKISAEYGKIMKNTEWKCEIFEDIEKAINWCNA